MARQKESSTLKDYVSLLLGRKRLVLTVFSITAAATTLGIFLIPPVYIASGTILIKFGREFVYRPEVGTLRDQMAFKPEEMVNTEVEILNSRDLVAQVVGDIGVAKLFPEILEDQTDTSVILTKAVASFQESISVKAVLESSIIKISFQHHDPQLAAAALNVLVEKFKDKHLEVFSDSKSGFVESELKKYGEKLAQSEVALHNFKEKHGLYQIPEAKDLLFTERNRARNELALIDSQIEEQSQKLCFLNESGISSSFPYTEQRKQLELEELDLEKDLRDCQVKIIELERRLVFSKDRM